MILPNLVLRLSGYQKSEDIKSFRREMGHYNADWILCPILTKIIADTDIENCAS